MMKLFSQQVLSEGDFPAANTLFMRMLRQIGFIPQLDHLNELAKFFLYNPSIQTCFSR